MSDNSPPNPPDSSLNNEQPGAGGPPHVRLDAAAAAFAPAAGSTKISIADATFSSVLRSMYDSARVGAMGYLVIPGRPHGRPKASVA